MKLLAFCLIGDLSERIQKQCGRMLPKEQIIDWFIQLCLALKYIHGMNILHRGTVEGPRNKSGIMYICK